MEVQIEAKQKKERNTLGGTSPCCRRASWKNNFFRIARSAKIHVEGTSPCRKL